MQRKKALIIPFDLLSHYLRCITLTQEHFADYEIVFAESTRYNHFVLQAGYSIVKIDGFDPERVMGCAIKFNFDWLNKEDIERVFLSQVYTIKTIKPDVVIGDTAPTLKMASEYTGVQYIALMNGYMSRYYAEVRKVSRTHYSYQYISKLPVKLAGLITRFAERTAFKAVHKPFKAIRKNYKLSKIPDYLAELEGDENLVCDLPELFPQKALPANYKFIVPLKFKHANNETELLSQLDTTKSTICVCMGSSGDWQQLVFLSQENYAFLNIIVAGDQQKLLKGSHIHSRDFINLSKILPHCKLLICHGGNGTIYEGISHRLLMLCLTNHFEQEWNVHMLESRGLGRFIHEAPQQLIDLAVNDLREHKTETNK